MKGITRRVFSVLLAAHAIAVLGLFLFTLFNQEKGLLPEFTWGWIVSTIIYRWIDLFAAITLTAFAFAFSVILTNNDVRSEIKGEQSFVRIAGGSIVLIIIVSAAFIAGSAFFYGPAVQNVEAAKTHSRDARSLVDDAKTLVEQRNFHAAIIELNHALVLAPAYLDAIELRDKCLVVVNSNQTKPEQKTENAIETEKSLNTNRVMDYAALVEKAEEFYKAGDYFSALYYANKAAEKSDRGSPELAELHTRIENAIRGKEPDPKEEKKRALYEMKQAAIIGSLQNNLPVEAYYQLLDIEKLSKSLAGKNGIIDENPGLAGDYQDVDVRKWMPVVLQKLQETVFFTDELESKIIHRVSSGNLLFLNRDLKDRREFIYAESLVEGDFGYYLIRPEIIVINNEGVIREHRLAQFGKISGHTLMLKAIDREKKTEMQEVKVLVGQFPTAIKNFVKVEPEVDRLWEISQGKSGYAGMSLPQQFGLLTVLQKLGYDSLPLEETLMMYVVKILSLGALCFFVMGWAWKLRNRNVTIPKFLTIIMVFALPAFFYFLTSLYWVANGTIVSSLLILLGFGVSIVVVLVFQAILLVLSLIYVSGQSAD